MIAPTKASLQRELRAMTKRADDLDAMHAQAIKALNKVLSAYADVMESKIALQSDLSTLKEAARPVIAYMDTQWPGSVGPELRRLKELCK